MASAPVGLFLYCIIGFMYSSLLGSPSIWGWYGREIIDVQFILGEFFLVTFLKMFTIARDTRSFHTALRWTFNKEYFVHQWYSLVFTVKWLWHRKIVPYYCYLFCFRTVSLYRGATICLSMYDFQYTSGIALCLLGGD